MPMKKCFYPSCREYIEYNLTYCSAHKKEQVKDYNTNVRKRSDHDKEIATFYQSKAWRNLRNRKKIKQPLCEICLDNGHVKQTEIIHHIVEVRDSFEKRLDYDNLQSVCRSCHNRLHGGSRKYY